jgi:hypothetical protein
VGFWNVLTVVAAIPNLFVDAFLLSPKKYLEIQKLQQTLSFSLFE